MIRTAIPDDAAALTEIWNHYITETSVTFSSVPKTVEEVAGLIAGRPVFLVAEEAGEIAGYATWSQFRGGDGYRHAIENQILLRPGMQGRGLGRALIEDLIGAAQEHGHHAMIAGISGENPQAVAFHHRLGFEQVAVMPELGHKFDRWIDLILMQRFL